MPIHVAHCKIEVVPFIPLGDELQVISQKFLIVIITEFSLFPFVHR